MNKPPQKIIPARKQIDLGINIANDYWHDWIDQSSIEEKISDWEEKEFGHYKCDCIPASKEQINKLSNSIRKMLKGENQK